MERKIQNIILIILGLVIGIVFTEYLEIELFDFSLPTLIILSIVVVGVLVIWFLIKSGYKSDKDDPHALGLPEGSIRATLALTLVILFVLVSLYFFAVSPQSEKLAERVLTILGTLVIAISSFYFGIKATEQGGKLAQNVFKQAIEPQESVCNIPPIIIQEAISENRDSWMVQYNCVNVKLGKKVAEETQFELNCIVFFVMSKEPPVDKSKEIPPTISYSSKGKQYSIPTDVRIQKEKICLSKIPSLDTINEFIIEKKDEWIEKYKVDAVIAALKIKAGETENIPCIQFIVKDKFNLPDDAKAIPEYFVYGDYHIITDVMEEDEPSADSSEFNPGNCVFRKDSSSKGTIGLKVYRDSKDKRIDYLLSCYHVFCNPELEKNKTVFKANNNSEVIAQVGNSEIVIANVVEGVFNQNLDAALSKIKEQVVVNPKLKGFPSSPKYGIKVITNRDVMGKTKVFSYGAVSKSTAGHIKAQSIDRKIKYFGKEYDFRNVILVSKISVPGDSGAVVVDEKGKVIGIVFASSSSRSYIIPISEIIHHFNIKIYYV